MQTRTRPMHRRLSLAALALLVAMGRTATAADEGMDRVRKSDLSQEADLSESMTQTLDLIRAEQDVELFQMGELVPSAEQPLKPTTSVYEITAQDILDQNARSVADALRFVPGLYLSVGGGKNPSNPIVRGLTIRQNVVFVDGRPVYDPFFGDIDLNNLPIDNVEKIKVVKGPVESAYGPNAIGAVINIVTKRGTSVPTTRLTASYESHNTQDYRDAVSLSA